MPSASELIGIGVDLISWGRAKRFLARHSFQFVSRLLKPSERDVFLKTQTPVEFFARCFIAKEAYFKARGGEWMGEAGFRDIETVMEKKDRFRIRDRGFRTEGHFFEVPDGIAAEVFVWKEGDSL